MFPKVDTQHPLRIDDVITEIGFGDITRHFLVLGTICLEVFHSNNLCVLNIKKGWNSCEICSGETKLHLYYSRAVF